MNDYHLAFHTLLLEPSFFNDERTQKSSQDALRIHEKVYALETLIKFWSSLPEKSSALSEDLGPGQTGQRTLDAWISKPLTTCTCFNQPREDYSSTLTRSAGSAPHAPAVQLQPTCSCLSGNSSDTVVLLVMATTPFRNFALALCSRAKTARCQPPTELLGSHDYCSEGNLSSAQVKAQ
jgi:hypothetical protein